MVKKTKQTKLTPTLLEEMRNKYVQGIEDNTGGRKIFTIDQLASDYNVSKPTLYKHAKKEEWKDKQKKFQDQYLLELDIRRQKELVEESISFDKTSLRIAKSIMGLVGKCIGQNIAPDKQVKPQDLVAFSNAASGAQRVAKLALGEATENMNINEDAKDSETFREAIRLLDEVADEVRAAGSSAIH